MKPNWFSVTNSASTDVPAEIRIYNRIGKSYWDDSGVDAKAFAEALQAIPAAQLINLRVNSPGGNVFDGLAIYNLLKDRGSKITCYVDGAAVSIASVIALAADTVIIPENGLFMIHDPSGYCEGTADDMEKAIQMLKACKDSIVSVYVNETGQSEEVIREKMTAQTWFTGTEAVDFGFATQLTAKVDVAACLKPFDLSAFKNVPKFQNTQTASNSTEPNPMKRNHILLYPASGETAGGGGAASSAATAATNQAAGDIISIKAELAAVTAQLAGERKNAVEKTIDSLIAEGRIEAGSREFWVPAALKDPSVIAELRKNQPIKAPTDNIKPVIDGVKASLSDITKEMSRLRAPQDAMRRGAILDAKKAQEDSKASAQAAAEFHWRNRDRMMEVMNANTIDAALKRNVVLQEICRAFAIKLAPLRAFSTVFGGIRLEGTDKITVPYFPLVGTASTDFVAANGYVMGDSTQSGKEVTINKRKYQPIRFDSSELARQPALNLMQIGVMKAEKLATDVFNDVLSVVTLANYGAASLISTAANFAADDVVDLSTVADTAEWPTTGRTLFLKAAYKGWLLKSNLISASTLSWQNYGSVAPIQDGIVARLAGFDIYQTEQIPANAENLVGMISSPSAIAVATSAINPEADVMNQLSAYELVTHPSLGISFEYRRWGNADFDQTRQVIECNYGFAVLEAAGLERITSA